MLLVQIRFFNGQYSHYTPEEFAALKVWLSQQDIDQAEHYFVDKVLRFKPDDLQKYPYSLLKKLFEELRKK